MGIGERKAGGAVETGIWRCGRAKVEDRGDAITGQRAAKAERSARCKCCFTFGPQRSQKMVLNSDAASLRCAMANVYCAT